MTEELQTLLSEFSSYFPNLDFSKVNSPYDQVERLLAQHINEFTPEQWQAICSSKYSELFQHGVPHIDWNTDRKTLCRALMEGRKPCKTWNETWYECRMYSIQMGNTVLEIKVEEPRSFGSGSTHYYLKVADVFIPTPTHRAIIIGIGDDTRAYIGNQFAGTLDECENWVAKNLNGGWFKIISLKA